MSDLMPTDDRPRSVERATPRAARRDVPRHARRRRFGPGGAITGTVLGVVAVLVVSTSAVGAVVANSLLQKAKDDSVVINTEGAIPPDIGAIDGGFNILIVGSDTRVGQGGLGGSAKVDSGMLNDVNILVHVAQDQSNATVVSFPRDLEVTLPSCARWFGYTNKINTSLVEAQTKDGTGLACVVQTVEDLTGLEIQFAGLITFSGVVQMADAVGGVDVCTTGTINDKDSGLYLQGAGTHTLTGDQALAFLRTRHGVGDGSDWGRVSSQQVYLSSLFRKVKSEGTLTNVSALLGLANAAISNMTLSSTLTDPYTLVSLALALKNIPTDRITFVQYPTSGTNDRGNAVENTAASKVLLQYLKSDAPFQLAQVGGGPGGGSTIDPNATTDPTDAATGSPTGSATDDIPTLPSSISGQTAADQTCSVANR